MIQGINSDYDSYYSVTSVTNISAEQASASSSEKTAQGSQSVRTDTVEISPQARAAMQQANSVVSAGGKSSAQNSPEQSGALRSGALQVSAATSSTSQTVLTNLTEAELDDLVSQGVITKAQEQAELSRRSAAGQQEQSDVTAQQTQTAGSNYQNAVAMYQLQAQQGNDAATGSLLNSVA